MLRKLFFLGIALASLLTAGASDSYRFTTYAGWSSATPATDGVGDDARFLSPQGMAKDAAGNIYVADLLARTVRKITPMGVVTTFAGKAGESGYQDGPAGEARFLEPRTLAFDASGNLYVGDSHAIRKITPAGVVSTFTGDPLKAGLEDGPPGVAHFQYPTGLAFDQSGTLWVADNQNNTVRRVSPTGYVSTVAGSPGSSNSVDGHGGNARFRGLGGLVIDAQGMIYVNGGVIRKVTPDGDVTTLVPDTGYGGYQDGPAATAKFWWAEGLTIDDAGNLYVADSNNQLIRRIAPDGTVSTVAGQLLAAGSADGEGTAGHFRQPLQVLWLGGNELAVAERGNRAIRKVGLDGAISTLAGSAKQGHVGGVRREARFDGPTGIARKPDGTVFVSDTNNHVIRAISPAGIVVDFAGAAGQAGYANGMAGEARFDHPRGIVLDAAGNLYVADEGNRRVRKITAEGLVSTLAGSGVEGWQDGVGEGAMLSAPNAITLSPAGVLYLLDGSTRVCTISSAGEVVTVYDGGGAHYSQASSIVVDANGVIYLGVWRGIVRISGSGPMSYLAGWESPPMGPRIGGDDGIGAYAIFNQVGGMTLAPDGQLIVADGARLRRVSLAGEVVTFAGKSGEWDSVDGSDLDARFSKLTGVLVDPTGDIYVVDAGNHSIRLGARNPEYPAGFDAGSYLDRNLDLRAAGFDLNGAWNHYLDYGAAEGRSYDDVFRAAEYLLLNADLISAFGYDRAMAALHWLTYGMAEHRRGRVPALFNVDNYFAANGDVQAAFASLPDAEKRVAAWNHYLDYGVFEGRSDSDFHPQTYLAEYPVLQAAFGGDMQAAAIHWYEIGRPEGWRVPRHFDVQTYLSRNPDVKAVYHHDLYGAWLHYYQYGLAEGRTFDSEFRVNEYLALYPDLQAAFGADQRGALMHWLQYGKDEGRLGRLP